MRRSISITTQSPSIVIVQGASERFCVPAEAAETTYGNLCDFGFIFAFDETAAGPTQEDSLKFQRLAAAWQQERGAMSSTTEAAMCPAYQSIIGMGPVALQLILRQLEIEGDDPDQWFWALTSITGATPENPDDRGNYMKMAASWFDWAKNNGYAW